MTREDIDTANRLAQRSLGRSLDELPPQTRKLLLADREMVRAECERLKVERRTFVSAAVTCATYTGWGDTQTESPSHRLEEMEYLLAHRGGRGQSFVYELLFEVRRRLRSPFLASSMRLD